MSQPQSSPFTIIQAGPEHLDLVAPLFDAYRVFYEQPSDLAGAKAFIQARLEQKDSVIFLSLAEEAGQTVGLGFVQLYPTLSSISMRPIWILNDLFVSPQVRSQGLGRALMERARELARETGAKRLILATAVDNFTAQSLYESLDYQRDERFYHYSLEIK
ncbi:MAG TPA: GNAT family N-acetyltransferase [Anaerolineae bacterium]|nr:GNAT family N-acetyltransferase [Anaerolineae bacterium]